MYKKSVKEKRRKRNDDDDIYILLSIYIYIWETYLVVKTNEFLTITYGVEPQSCSFTIKQLVKG